MIRATATVVLHNFSMYANAAAKGNAVLVTFHSQPWCLIGPVSLLNEPEKKTCRVLNATDAYTISFPRTPSWLTAATSRL